MGDGAASDDVRFASSFARGRGRRIVPVRSHLRLGVFHGGQYRARPLLDEVLVVARTDGHAIDALVRPRDVQAEGEDQDGHRERPVLVRVVRDARGAEDVVRDVRPEEIQDEENACVGSVAGVSRSW